MFGQLVCTGCLGDVT